MALQRDLSEDLAANVFHKLPLTVPFPKKDGKPADQLFTEVIAERVEVPISQQGDYCLRLTVVAKGRDFKRGWCFESFAVTKS